MKALVGAVDIGASIGVAVCPDHGEDPATLLQRADVAMYAAKESQSTFRLYAAEHDSRGNSPRTARSHTGGRTGGCTGHHADHGTPD